MKQSNPKLTKINYIAQVSKNLVGQNGTKLTKVTGTQSNEMKQIKAVTSCSTHKIDQQETDGKNSKIRQSRS